MARILLIEDDELLREGLAHALSSSGYTVVSASNGFDGMALHRQEHPDLVLTDIIMPQGGLLMIRVLRSQFPDLPIVAMSGNHTRLELAGALGAVRTLAKPFTFPELIALLNEALPSPAC